MAAKLKYQIKEAIHRINHPNHNGNSDTSEQDLREVLKDLLKQVEESQREYVRQMDVLKGKYIADSETIRMGIVQLLSTPGSEERIRQSNADNLRSLARRGKIKLEVRDENHSELKEKVKQLARLEKEIVEILSRRFTG